MLVLWFSGLFLCLWGISTVPFEREWAAQRTAARESLVVLWDVVRIGTDLYLQEHSPSGKSVPLQQLPIPSGYTLPDNIQVYCNSKGGYIWMEAPPPGFAAALAHYYALPCTRDPAEDSPGGKAIAAYPVGFNRSGRLVPVLPYEENTDWTVPSEIKEGALVLYIASS